MRKVFFAIYDDANRKIPYFSYFQAPFVIYRTPNVGFIEELSALGFEPTAVLLEEDIAHLLEESYNNEALSDEDLQWLLKHKSKWVIQE